MKRTFFNIMATAALLMGGSALNAAEKLPDAVLWHDQGGDENTSMPVGNGDIAANVWVDCNGEIVLLMAKSDAWSENAQLLKVGRVRVSLKPNPFTDAGPICTKLDIAGGTVSFSTPKGTASVWVDANNPVVRVKTATKEAVSVSVRSELWRKNLVHLSHEDLNKSLFNYWEWRSIPQGIDLLPDTVLPCTENDIAWCHYNSTSMYPVVLEREHLGNLVSEFKDPLLGRCWGVVISGQGSGKKMKAKDDSTLESVKPAKEHSIDMVVEGGFCDSAQHWAQTARNKAEQIRSIPAQKALKAHLAWWKEFWGRSHIEVWGCPEAEQVSIGYAMQRYQMACASRGAYPVKFNGSLFTVGHDLPEGEVSTYENHNPDFRDWGSCYWHQNGRHMYYPLVASGDYDMLKPWFDLYLNSLPLASAKVKQYFGHEGAAWIETMHFWGLPNLMDFGWDNPGNDPQSRYMSWHTQGALEVLVNMLDYWDNTQDNEFLCGKILPMAEQVLKYYNNHWKRGADGKILFDPTQSIEMYQFGVVDDTPTIAGLRSLCSRITAIPRNLVGEELAALVGELSRNVPEIPLGRTQGGKLPLRADAGDKDGKSVILPARIYGDPSNGENPELYTVFPYRNFCIGKAGLKLARDTFEARRYPFDNCWGQDGMEAALLGLTDVAAKAAHHAFTTTSDQRYKWFWRKVADYAPDMDNGGTGAMTLQLMLMQSVGDKIYLLPAWPEGWNADFKLHAPKNTVISARVENGKLVKMDVSPKSRTADVIVNNR